MADALEQIATAWRTLRYSRLGVMIGGEHTASLGGFRGLQRVRSDAVILQVGRPSRHARATTKASRITRHVAASGG